jgi:hypothetical protein
MKRLFRICIALIVLAIPSFFIARHYTDRARQARNVRHDAQWFVTSLKLGNERAAANYLAQPSMDSGSLDQALRIHARSLLLTNFETAPLQLRSQDSILVATFSCSDGAQLTFASADDGDMWRFHDLKAQ